MKRQRHGDRQWHNGTVAAAASTSLVAATHIAMATAYNPGSLNGAVGDTVDVRAKVTVNTTSGGFRGGLVVAG